jgi:hypothetical protein
MEKRKNFLIEKILRFKPIAFVRKYKYIFLVLGIFLLTYIVGIWKIKKYEILNIQGEETDTVYLQVEEYIKENILEENYFSFHTPNIEKQMYSDIPYLRTVIVEKIMPNKVNVIYEQYNVEIIGELNDHGCYLLSTEGYMLDQKCEGEEDADDCCMSYAHEQSIKYLNAEVLSMSDDDGGRKKLLVMDSIYDLIEVFNSLSLVVENIDLGEELMNVYTSDDKKFVFDFNHDLMLQLQRLYVVMGKIEGDDLDYETLDLRFERPVLK